MCRLEGKGLPKLDSKEVGDHILVMRVPDAVKSDGMPPSAKEPCSVSLNDSSRLG